MKGNVDLILHVLASIGLGNALAVHFLEVRTLIPGEYVSPVTVLSAAWFLLAFIIKKQVVA